MVLAVGDISGKGISAALLMATVHAFVRAYSLEPDLALAPLLMAGAARLAAATSTIAATEAAMRIWLRPG